MEMEIGANGMVNPSCCQKGSKKVQYYCHASHSVLSACLQWLHPPIKWGLFYGLNIANKLSSTLANLKRFHLPPMSEAVTTKSGW